jgi:hypothetical protein
MESAARLLWSLYECISPRSDEVDGHTAIVALFGLDDPITEVHLGRHPLINTRAVGVVTEQYLKLKWRSGEIDRLLLRLYLSASIFSYAEKFRFKRIAGVGITIEHHRDHPRSKFWGTIITWSFAAVVLHFGVQSAIERGWLPRNEWLSGIALPVAGLGIFGALVALLRNTPIHMRALAHERARLDAMVRAYRALPSTGPFRPDALEEELDKAASLGAEWPPGISPLLQDIRARAPRST